MIVNVEKSKFIFWREKFPCERVNELERFSSAILLIIIIIKFNITPQRARKLVPQNEQAN